MITREQFGAGKMIAIIRSEYPSITSLTYERYAEAVSLINAREKLAGCFGAVCLRDLNHEVVTKCRGTFLISASTRRVTDEETDDTIHTYCKKCGWKKSENIVQEYEFNEFEEAIISDLGSEIEVR